MQAFVYLSGRGVQYNGDNYFVPVDAQKASQNQDLEMVSFFGVWMQRENLAQAMWMFFGLVALVVVLVLAQVAVMPQLRFLGVIPDLGLVAAVAAARASAA